MTASYHCYFGTGQRLRKKVDIDAADDALAIMEAERILADTKQGAMEIWRGARLISRFTQSKPAAQSVD